MNVTDNKQHSLTKAKQLWLCLAVAVCLLFANRLWALTPANTLISNQATASYQSADGAQRLATSNSVRTVVTAVAALDLVQDQSRDVLAGGQVSFMHIITNTGNVDDSYNLVTQNLGGDDFDFAAIEIFADADANGQPDTAQAITQTPVLSMQESFNLVIVATVNGGQSTSTSAQLSFQATSALDGAVLQTNTDTSTVVDDAIIEISQSISVTSGFAGDGPIHVTYSYVNTGSRAATDVTLENALPAGFNYAGNATWSFGNTPLTDANEDLQGSAPAITYCAYDNATCDEDDMIRFVISEVGAGQSGSVSFDINIDGAQLPGVLQNTGVYGYQPFTQALVEDLNTNTVPFTVLSQQALNFSDDSVVDAVPGTTVFLTHTLTNQSTGSETFNIRVDDVTSNFPAGTAFFLYQADGLTPLTDSNLDGDLDSGPLAAALARNIIIGVTLPPSAATGSYSVNLRATSLTSSNVFDLATATVDVLAPVLAVDLTAIAAAGDPSCDEASDNCGFDAYNSADPAALTVSVDPGDTASFVLYAKNLSEILDSFGFEASTDETFASVTLPNGWNANFTTLGGQPMASTGTMQPQGDIAFKLDVSVPATQVVVSQTLYVQVVSPTSLREDRIKLTIDVNEVEGVVLGPDNASTEEPNQFVVYRHDLVNNGNADELIDSLVVGISTPDWTVALFEDTAGGTDGEWDVDDQLLTGNFTLAAGETKVVFVRVFIPSSATPGQIETTTLTATYNSGSTQLVATNTITANPFEVEILKEQAKDENCDGVAETAYSTTSFSAMPGHCILYRLTVSNDSSITAVNAVVKDGTPEFTIYSNTQPATRCVPSVCSFVAEPAALDIGDIEISVGDISPGNNVVFFFSVRVSDS